MYIYIIIYYKYLFFSIFPRFILYPGIFCSPSVWNWWVLTKRVDARGNENSISLFPVCETKQKSGWIYPDMVHFPLLSNCPAEQNLFFRLSFRLIFEFRFFDSWNELKKKKRILTHAKVVQRKLAEREGKRGGENAKTAAEFSTFAKSTNEQHFANCGKVLSRGGGLW